MAEDRDWDWEEWASQGAAHRRVWAFLTLDIQRDRGAAIALLSQIDQLMENPDAPGFGRSGNAYHIQSDPQGVTLSTLVVEEPDVCLALPPFREALVAWIDHLET